MKGAPVTLDLDSHRIDIPCPSCGKNISETIGQLKADPDLTCTCGQVIHIEAEKLRAGIEQAEKAVADFERELGRLSR